ncbi:MAG TPA: GGDEF domain-containing protein [Caulobacteraceae bacterium]|nr:GGDEF domain-containing protein [Caulobacteraceae bacterium]
MSARAERFAAIRRRALAAAGAAAVQTQAADEATGALGLDPEALPEPVRAALQTLVTEVDDLRAEVGRLKAQLADAEALADQDPLTPVKNRRAFARELKRAAAFVQRYGAGASLVYFDLDGFKSVNDRFGHAAGDAALQAVAHRLSANVRDTDVVGRMGGDEFAVILGQIDEEAAQAKAAALAAVIEASPVQCGDWSVPLHISYGVRRIVPGADPEVLLAEADAMMFVRKRTAATGS